MEAETNSPEDASAVSVPLVESITNIGSEGIKFPQTDGNEVNSKYPLVEETRKADSIKTDVVSETRPEEIYHESSKAFVESEEQTEQLPEGHSIEKKILRHADSGPVTTEPIPKPSELEDESMSTSPELAINQDEIAQKSFDKETYYEEEPPATDIDQSCRPQNELEQTSKTLEAIDLTQYTGKDAADKEHTDHQSEARSMEDDTKEKLVIENDGKLDEEEAKGVEDPTKTQLLNTPKESVAEDEALQTLPTAAPVRNEAADERSQEEIQPETEFVGTYTKEVQTLQHEFDENKDIPEEVETGLSAANEEKLEYQPAAQNEETTFIKESHSYEDIAEINSTHDTEKQEVPESDTNKKLLIKDDGRLNQEEATHIEDPQRSEPENEALKTLPTAASVENEALDESSQEDIQTEAAAMTYTNEVQTSKYEFNVKTDIPEEETELSEENEQKSEPQPVAQREESTILKQTHLNEDTAEINPVDETEEQEVPASEAKEKQVIKDEGDFYQDEAKQIEDPVKSVSEDKALQTLPTAASVKNEAVDESSQEIQLEAELAVTYTKEGEREELSAENEQELESQPAAQNEENTITKHPHLDDETTEINPSNETEEQEVRESDTRDIPVTEDDGKFNQEEARHVEDPTKSVHEDESAQILPAAASVQNEAVDESIDKEMKPEVQLEVTNINEVKIPQYEFNAKKDIPKDEMELTAENKEELEPEAAAQTEETTTVKEPRLNEEIEEINPIKDTAEQEVPASDMNEKLVIEEDDGKLDQEQVEQIEVPTKRGLPDDESLQTIPTTASVENEVVDEAPAQNEQTTTLEEKHSKEETAETNPSNTNEKLVIEDEGKLDQVEAELIQEAIKSVQEDESVQKIPTATSVESETVDESIQEEKQQEVELEVTYTNEVQTQRNEFEAEKDIPKDVTEVSAENEQEPEPEAAAQTEETTTVKEPHLNEVTAEINPINDTAEQEVPAYDVNDKLVVEDDGKLDQEKAKQIEESTKSLPEDESLQTLPTAASVENEAPDESSKEIQSDAQLEQINTEEVQTLQNTLNTKNDIPEDETLITAENKQETENEAAAQNEETTTVKEAHLNEETAETNPINETAEQESIPESHTNENLLIKDHGKLDQEEAEHIKESTKGVQQDESVQPIPTVTSVENEAVDESSQKEKQQEADIEVAYTDELKTQQNGFEAKKDIPEDETELSAENTQESEQEIAAQIKEISTETEVHSNEETTAINPVNDTAEQEVPAADENDKLVTEDDHILDQEEAIQIQETTKSLLEDESLRTLATAAPIENEVFDEALAQKEQTTTVKETHSNEETAEQEKLPTSDTNEKPVTADDSKLDQVEAERIEDPIKSLQEDEPVQTIITRTLVENEAVDKSSQEEKQQEPGLKVTNTNEVVQDESELCVKSKHESEPEAAAQTEETSTVKEEHSNAENVEINHINDTSEQEVSAGNANEKIVIEDDDKSDIVETEQIEEQTKPSVEDEVVHEALAQNEQTTTLNETHSNEETAEINPINDTAEQKEVPSSDTNVRLMIEDDGILDQERAEQNEEPTKSLPEDESLQTLPTVASVENKVVDEAPAEKDQTTTAKETYSNVETAEINAINEIVEQETVPTSDTHDKVVIEDDGKLDQVEAKVIKEPIESVQENEFVQTTPTVTSVKNEAVDESSKEENQQEAELEVTYMNEVQTQQNEFDAKKNIPEDETVLSAENKQESQPEAAVQTEETSTGKEASNEETVEINYINDTAEQEVQSGNTNEKLVIEDDCKSDQVEAEQIEALTKSLPEDEPLQTLPTTASIENKIVDDAASQSEKTTTLKETHSNEETAETNPISYTAEEVAASNGNDKIVIKDDSKVDLEKAEQIEGSTISVPEEESVQTLPTATSVGIKAVDESSEEQHQEAELEVTYIEELQTQQNEIDTKKHITEDETELSAENKQAKENTIVKETHSNEETVEINTVNNTAEQEEIPAGNADEKLVIDGDGKNDQEEAEKIEDPTNSLPEDESLQTLTTAASIENVAADEAPAKNEQTSTIKETHSNEEASETNPIDETVEQEKVPISDTNEKLVINDGEKVDQVEAELIEEPIKSVQEDENVHTSPTATSVEREAIDDSSQEKHQEAELEETYTNEVQTQQNEVKPKIHISEDETELSAENTQESQPEAAALTKETTTVEDVPSNEETTEVNPINDTAEQEDVPASDVNEKLVIEDDNKLNQKEAKLIEESTKSIPADDFVQTLPTETLVENEEVDESSQEKHQKEELTVTYTKEDVMELSANQELETEAAAQTKETTPGNELHLNEEIAEINHINHTVEEEFPVSDINEKLVIKDDGKIDQEKVEQIEEQTKKDESVLSTSTSVGNKAVDGSSEEQHQEAELEVTYTEELQIQQNEKDANKQIPQDEIELNAENKQESEREAVARNKENTILKEAHSNEEAVEINTINDTAEQEEIPAGNANEKVVINEDGKNDQEEAEQIEDPTKILPEDESFKTLTTTASIENKAVDDAPEKNEQTTTAKETHSMEEASETNPIDETTEQEKVPTSDTNEKLVINDGDKFDQGEAELIEEPIKSVQEDKNVETSSTATSVEREAIDSSQEKHTEAELEETNTNEVQTQQNEVKPKIHLYEDETELSAENTQESQPEAAAQTTETTTVREVPSNEETAEVNPIDDTAEQDVPALDVNEKLVIEDDNKFNQEEAKQIEESTKSIPEDDFVQTLPTATLVENEEVDESSQEEKHHKEELAVTYTKEDVTELSAKSNQESETEAAAQTKETTPGNELHLNEETAEINHINHTAEQEEFPVSDINEKLVIEDDGKIDQEEVEQIEEPTKSVQEDENVQTLPTVTSVEREAIDDSSQEQHQEAELEETYTNEVETQQSEVKAKMHISEHETELSAKNNQESEPKAAAKTEETTTEKEHLNEEHAEINPINDATEQEEFPASDMKDKLVIEDDGEIDQERGQKIQEPTKSVLEDESVQTLPTTRSVRNKAVDESSEEQHQEAELEVTHTDKLQTQQNEIDTKKDISEDEMEIIAENEEELEPKAAAQTEETITVKEPQSNEEPAEINPINDTAEQEVPAPNVNDKPVIDNDGRLNQEEAKHIEEPTKSLHDESLQTIPTIESAENEAVDDSSKDIQPDGQLEVTYRKEIQALQNQINEKEDIPEYETELSAEHKQESEAAAQNEETTKVKELPSNEGTAEINPINDTAELKVPASDANEELVIEDDGKLDQEETKHIEEPIKSFPEDESLQTIPPTASVENEAVEQIQTDAQLQVTYTKEVQAPQNEFNAKKDFPEDVMELSADNKQKSEPKAAAQNEETTTVKEPHSNEESAEINPINDIAEQVEVPASDANEKLVIVDDGPHDQEEMKQIEEPSNDKTTTVKEPHSNEERAEINPINDTAEQVEVPASDANEKLVIVDDGPLDQEEMKQIEEPSNDETTTVKEPHSNEESAEINPINDTAEQVEVPASDANEKLVIVDDGPLDQEEMKQIEEPSNDETTTVKEPHSNEESAKINPINDTAEQVEVPAFDANEKLVIVDDGQLDQEEMKHIEEPSNDETTTVKEPHSNEESAEINPINDTAEQVEVPASDANEKLVIVDDGQFDQEEMKQIEETSNDETTTVKEPHSNEESAEINPINDTAEQVEVPASDANEKLVIVDDGQLDQEEMKQIEEPSNDETTTVKEPHSNEESAEINLINDTAEQVEVPAFDANEKLVIVDDGPLDQAEMKQIDEPSKSLPEDEPLQSLATTASVINEAVDESSKEEIQPNTQLEVTHTKEVQTPNSEFNTKKDIPEDVTELSAANKQEIEPEIASQSKGTTAVKELYSNEETAEIKSIMAINDTAEREVPAFDANEKIVFQDDGKFIQEEAKDNEDPTKSLPEDESLHSLLTAAAVKNEPVDESSHGEIQPEAQLPLRYTKEDGSELSAENKLKSESQVAEQKEETTTVKQPHLEETAEINHTDDTEKKEEVPPFNAKEKLVIEDQGKLDQDKAKQLQKATKSVPEDESMQTLPTAASVQNDESCQEEIQQKAELEVTDAKEVQTPQIEFHEKKDILEDEPKLSAENEQKLASQAATQNETKPAATDTKEDQGSDNDLAKNVEVLEAFDFHKAPDNYYMENEKKALIQSEAKSQETMITKHSILEAPETAEISPRNDTNELEKENEVAKPGGVSESASTETTEQMDTTTTGKEAISRDFDIKTEQTDTKKLETQETTQFNSAKEDEVGDEFEKISPSSTVSVISRDSQDTDMKVSNKKSHGILSGVGSKVKHSISKVKKAITGKSSHQKTAPAKESK